jgi:putative oxidoreductase
MTIRFPHTVPGIVALVLRMALGGLFVWTGWVKTQDPTAFLFSIRSFQILPDPWAAWLAMGLPWLEIAAGAALVTGLFIEGGLTVIAGMLGVFLWAIIYSWQRKLDLNCGCFGGDANVSDYQSLIRRDVVLLSVALTLLVHRWIVWMARCRKRRIRTA